MSRLRAAARLFRHRSLLLTLTGRELKARYRGSLLGFLWSLVNPLLMLGVYTFVFTFVFQPRESNESPYALFLVTGLFPWIWFQSSVLEAATSLQANAGLIRKAAFPAELLPLVPVLANLVHFALALPVIALAFLVFRRFGFVAGDWTVVGLPLVVAVELPFVAGLALGLAALNAHFKDVRDLLVNALTLLFFLSPVLYSLRTVEALAEQGWPWVYWLVSANPLTPFVSAYHDVLFYGVWPPAERWATMALLALIAWAGGTWLFERLSETLVEAV